MSRYYSVSEQTIYSETCRSHLFFFWLPTRFKVTNRRLMVESHNTLMGVLPIGRNTENIIYRNIASVHSTSKLYVIRFLIGLSMFTSSFRIILYPDFYLLGIIELIIGFLLLCHCYKAKLKIVTNGGQSTEIKVPIFESRKINRITKEINNQLY